MDPPNYLFEETSFMDGPYTTKAYLVKSDAPWPTYLSKNLTSYVNAPWGDFLRLLGLWKIFRQKIVLCIQLLQYEISLA